MGYLEQLKSILEIPDELFDYIVNKVMEGKVNDYEEAYRILLKDEYSYAHFYVLNTCLHPESVQYKNAEKVIDSLTFPENTKVTEYLELAMTTQIVGLQMTAQVLKHCKENKLKCHLDGFLLFAPIDIEEE